MSVIGRDERSGRPFVVPRGERKENRKDSKKIRTFTLGFLCVFESSWIILLPYDECLPEES